MTRIQNRSSQAKNTGSEEDSEQAGEAMEAELSEAEVEALRALGLTNTGSMPTEKTPLGDLLLYGLSPYGGPRPDHGIVLGVAAELEAWAMFIEGPLGITVEMLARRLRAAVDLSKRLGHSPSEAA